MRKGENRSEAIAGCIMVVLAMLAQVAIWVFSIWVIVQIVKWAWFA